MADRHTRRRPFAWMKRLANLKNSSTSPQRAEKKHHGLGHSKSKSHQIPSKNNNPYPESGHLHRPAQSTAGANGRLSYSTARSEAASDYSSYVESNGVTDAPGRSNKSAAPTVATNPGTIHSDAGFSKAGTSNTIGGGLSSRDGGANSTFSSPNHSDRSLTTTLTTIQSTAPSGMLNPTTTTSLTPAPPNTNLTHSNSLSFSQPYPMSPPASAVPPHLQQQLHPHTYSAATANNILTDDASILTLASSSKRRRRRSLDTDASVRALAPSSLFGNSRESLPLSVLSGNTAPGDAPRPSVGGLASAERASVYSSSGVTAPALSSERNSYYADKTKSISSTAGVSGMVGVFGGEAGSVRSGMIGHGKTDSISGMSMSSPLTSPREASINGKLSRKGSDWTKEDVEEQDAENTEVEAMYEEGSEEEDASTEPAENGGNGKAKKGSPRAAKTSE
ncbi:hypothetical protein NA57DRAFT_36089 [Rhizodiscina lignyota]|uniref:Uncharacterized protein n=1 Tax=Rhizodiscina lignyota TaxID=1504668 RepID=A0A9P4IMX2_9PEZI|nr:hypothetical protein NA57DRAFT_36089 [Rhizodiscina lignyota]